MRSIVATCVVTLSLVACGSNKGGGDTDGGNGGPDACVGLECQVVDCGAMGLPATSLSGTVYAPNGTLPLYGIQVYIPLGDPGPVSDELACDRCSSSLPGGAVAQATSGEDGTFRLDNVPVGDNIPLIITSGKWRRQITIPRVEQCVDAPLTAAETRLPKTKAEGNIPKIAITTGNADTLECLARKLGIDDTEIGKQGDGSRIHLFTGNGVSSFAGTHPGGTGAIPTATTFWNTVDNLKAYDIVILSCEGQQNAGTKPQAALDAMKAYADMGGRVFASHWHNIWVSGHYQGTGDGQSPAVWDTIGTWNNGTNYSQPIIDVIDEVSNPKGGAFATWMLNVMGSTIRGEVSVTQARTTSVTLDTSKAEQWVYTKGQTNPNVPAGRAQMFQFTTPNEVLSDQRCGKVVFTDMHVSGSPQNLNPYPGHCVGGNDLTPQEKALAFMFFDIASCVGGIF